MSISAFNINIAINTNININIWHNHQYWFSISIFSIRFSASMSIWIFNINTNINIQYHVSTTRIAKAFFQNSTCLLTTHVAGTIWDLGNWGPERLAELALSWRNRAQLLGEPAPRHREPLPPWTWTDLSGPEHGTPMRACSGNKAPIGSTGLFLNQDIATRTTGPVLHQQTNQFQELQ